LALGKQEVHSMFIKSAILKIELAIELPEGNALSNSVPAELIMKLVQASVLTARSAQANLTCPVTSSGITINEEHFESP
jgi:hypothetical protein